MNQLKIAWRFLLLLSICSISICKGQEQATTVFESGTNGYQTFRIPAMIKSPNGSILAFCEGRINSSDDFGNINIVLKRSEDGGKTWNELQTIVDYGNLQAGNPAPVVDYSDSNYPTGKIFLFYNTGNNHEYEIRQGKGIREVWYKTSIDNGITWSEGVNITLQTHLPNQPQMNSAYNFKEDWRSYANTPGHAIQIENGKFKGRIIVAANHSIGNPKEHFEDYFAHTFYSDDHGNSFKIGEPLRLAGSNESMVTELSNNQLMMNSRNQKGDIRARIVSKSADGGETWEKTYFDTVLIDPVNQGSILTLGYKKMQAIIAFCNTADTRKRDHLTLRISYDEGHTWNKQFVIDKSNDPKQKDFTAYSDMILLNKHNIGILYERDNYRQIVFKSLKWH